MSGAGQGRLAPGAETLAEAVRAVAAVAHDGQSADEALAAVETREDRAAVRAIALGTLRWYLRLAPVMAGLVARPPQELDPMLRALLVTGAHQVEYSRGAPEVSVHLAVDAARALGLARTTGLVNAVLRRFVRERVERFAAVDHDLATRHAHPAWLVEALREAWPDALESILEAANRHPPMTLRVDLSRGSVEGYVAELAANGRPARALAWRPGAVVLEHPAPVGLLPGFREGRVSVQDAGAQLAAALLDVQPGQRVLDACAAPGGKALLLADAGGGRARVVAAEASVRRVATLARLRDRWGAAEVRVVAADGRRPPFRTPFDLVLLDAPCTGLGTLARHPDIRWRLLPDDVGRQAGRQAELLAALAPLVRPGGRLVYATCSIEPEENEGVVGPFLAARPDFAPEAAPDWAREFADGPFVRVEPSSQTGDAFFVAILRRGAAVVT